MYAEFDVLGAAEARAAKEILADRLAYQPFYEAGEAFLAEKGLVLGGAVASRLLLGGDADLDAEAFQLEAYSANALAHARELADRLHAVEPEGRGRYAAAVTRLENAIFVVSVDNRPLYTLAALPRTDGVRHIDLLGAVPRPAPFARTARGAPARLLCAPPAIQLQPVYAALCDPARAADWGGLLESERALRALLPPAPERRGRPPRRGPAWLRLHAALCADFLPGAGRVLLAPGGGPAGGERLRVVTDEGLAAAAAEAARVAGRAQLEVQWAELDPAFPADRRLRRATVYLVERGGREAVLDLYNAAEYRLIPYVRQAEGGRGGGRGRGRGRDQGGRGGRGRGGRGRDRGERDQGAPAPQSEPGGPRRGPRAPAEPGVPVGRGTRFASEFAQMDFLLVEIWAAGLQAALKKIAKSAAEEAAAELRAAYDEAAARLEAAAAAAEADPEAWGPGVFARSYVGHSVPPAVALRREASAARFHHPPYLPLLAKRQAAGVEGGALEGVLFVVAAGGGEAAAYGEHLGLALEIFAGDPDEEFEAELAGGQPLAYVGRFPAEALARAREANRGGRAPRRLEVLCGGGLGAARAAALAPLADFVVAGPPQYASLEGGGEGAAALAAELAAALAARGGAEKSGGCGCGAPGGAGAGAA